MSLGEATRTEKLSSPGRPHRWADWRILRALLLVVFVVAVAGTWLSGVKHSSYSDLRGDVASGRTHAIAVSGGLPPGAVGDATMRIQWWAGHHRNYAEVTQVSAAGEVSPSGTDPVVYGDVAPQLRALSPHQDLQVGQAAFTTGTEVAGWQVPDWVVPMSLLLWLATVVILVNGPPPRYATRWAWFWMIATPVNVVGVPIFLAVSEPWRSSCMPAAAKPPWRLTGGKAFLATFVVCSMLGLAWF